jgi:hypothetical protein
MQPRRRGMNGVGAVSLPGLLEKGKGLYAQYKEPLKGLYQAYKGKSAEEEGAAEELPPVVLAPPPEEIKSPGIGLGTVLLIGVAVFLLARGLK